MKTALEEGIFTDHQSDGICEQYLQVSALQFMSSNTEIGCMMSGFEITCVNKDQRDLIIRIGGNGWSMPIQKAITDIISNQLRLYIRVDAQFFEVKVRGEGFDSYLALEPDGFPLHELTNLPSC